VRARVCICHCLQVYWQSGKINCYLPGLEEIRKKVQTSLDSLRNDHKRNLNPTPYKVFFLYKY
jgi:nicotinate phosphoribosyltransferase